ncbi:hypothetical protein SAMN05421823_101240 [Catalinimonas alkaloidigena]|uniref:ABC-2 type transport system permease protein n=1 Tax=Catalinimonas alkaloidigena TaxID=1075417 RepID=A0A1G8X1D5_9BACT|nr:DUF5687 family protein [Catalinimonas alkaloidigena]SDJ84422.1 hypothetical protein SAMN05421823_101240 [Catalinimonas alkaloidigena]
MINWLLAHQWKAQIRSTRWQQNVVLNLLVILGIIYFVAIFLMAGLFGNALLRSAFPDDDPTVLLTQFLFYYAVSDLMLRFFWQRLPTLVIAPYLHLPVSRNRLLHFLLGRSFFSVFNLLPVLLLVPFAFREVMPEYGATLGRSWLVGLLAILFGNNFLNFYLKKSLFLRPVVAIGVLLLLTGLLILDLQGIGSFSAYFRDAVFTMAAHTWGLLVPLGWLGASYLLVYRLLRRQIYLEETRRTSQAYATDPFAWLEQRGIVGELMGMELKMIWRNKRSRTQLFTSILLFVYPLVLYRNPSGDRAIIGYFIGYVVLCGGVAWQYGQLLFSWESMYFDGFLSLPMTLSQYLRAKYGVLVLLSTLTFGVMSCYGFLDLEFFYLSVSCALYGIGINLFLTLLLGTWRTKRIDPTERAFFNFQGNSLMIFLLAIPVFLVPFWIYKGVSALATPQYGYLALGVLGVIGLLRRNFLLQQIEKQLLHQKYKMAAGFRTESE